MIAVLVITVAGVAAYVWESRAFGRWVGGASRVGLTLGIFAGTIILFEMMLWPRKWLRRFRFLPAKVWMVAHLWLGVVCVPAAILHSGFHWGGWLPTTLMVLFLLTSISGIYGWIVQSILPGWMLRNIASETIHSQIDFVAAHAARDVRRALQAVCGNDPQLSSAADPHDRTHDDWDQRLPGSAVVVGAMRRSGTLRGRTLATLNIKTRPTGSNPYKSDPAILWQAFHQTLEPFLLHGQRLNNELSQPSSAAAWFTRLRASCDADSEELIDCLENYYRQRVEFDLQKKVHRLLHAWVPFHASLAVAVTVLMLIHAWTAMRYW